MVDADELACFCKEFYDNLIIQGFTEQQAEKILLKVIQSRKFNEKKDTVNIQSLIETIAERVKNEKTETK